MVSNQEEIFKYLISHPKGVTFIHGKAGCGKTHLIRKIENEVDGCLILTPTNLSASLYRTGRTYHSFFYGAFDDLAECYQNPDNLTDAKLLGLKAKLSKINLIIIDEVSMVRADYMEMMHEICRQAMGNDLAFGGIPIALVGDLFQLPPIVSEKAVLDYLIAKYSGIYFFNSHVIQNNLLSITFHELNTSYRQKNDPNFVKLLDSFREPLSEEEKIKLLDELNSRVVDDLPEDGVYVASSNAEVQEICHKNLEKLAGETITIDAEYEIKLKHSSDRIKVLHSKLKEVKEDINTIILPSQYEGRLQAKVGARVVLTKSSKYWGYMNGDFGTVTGFDGESFKILLDRTSEEIQCPNPNDRYYRSQLTEYRYEMIFDKQKRRLIRKPEYIQKTTQFPIKLAYAFTIHKAQGQTYDKVIVDLNSHLFAPGQLYVALSRAKSLDGLYLTKAISYSDIISDESIFTFLGKLRGEQKVAKKSAPIRDALCDNFKSYVASHEDSDSYKENMLFILDSYKTMVHMGEYSKAHSELQKVVDLIISTYQLDDFSVLVEKIKSPTDTAEGCKFALNGIFEIYTSVVDMPHQKIQTDDRLITFKLQ